jgi:DNA-binding protein H-NS
MAREPKTSASDVVQLLENLTVADLERVIAAAGQQRAVRLESGRRELIEEFRAKAAEMGLSLDELLGSPAQAGRTAGKARSARRGASAASPAARYRNPETGETWSGRGRVPRWLKPAEEQGRGREEFAVKG